ILRGDESGAQRTVSLAPVVCECLSSGRAAFSRPPAREAALVGEDRGAGRHGPDPGGPGHRETGRVVSISRMTDIQVPISPGELLDKITILRIKVARILDAAKLANVRLELDLLEKTWRDSRFAAADVARDERALQEVNERLWDIEDRIREKEARQTFDREFIELARAVYHSNDERAAIKRRINTALGSRLVEEKSYQAYR